MLAIFCQWFTSCLGKSLPQVVPSENGEYIFGFVHIETVWVVTISAEILRFNKCEPAICFQLSISAYLQKNIRCCVAWDAVVVSVAQHHNEKPPLFMATHGFQSLIYAPYLLRWLFFVFFSFFTSNSLHLILREKCCSICFSSAYTL